MKTKFYHFLTLCVTVLILSGCATGKPPALNSDMKSIDTSKESIALLTVKIANEYKTGYQPNVKHAFIWSHAQEDRKKYSFSVSEKYNEEKNVFNEYLLSFQLPPGKYRLRELFAQSGTFPVIGTFAVPLYSTFSIEPGKIIYLGHIEAVVKERTDEQMLRAGPVIPLIDQAVTGASGGTFIITIKDLYETDIKLFQQKYPYLMQHTIENSTLPQWRMPTPEDLQ